MQRVRSARTLDAVKYIGDATWWWFVTPVTDYTYTYIKTEIRPNHLVNLIFVWPGETLRGGELHEGYLPLRGSAREHCSERNLKRLDQPGQSGSTNAPPTSCLYNRLPKWESWENRSSVLPGIYEEDLWDWRLQSATYACEWSSLSVRSFAPSSPQSSSK